MGEHVGSIECQIQSNDNNNSNANADKQNKHSRWDNVMRHKSPSSFHFAALNAAYDFVEILSIFKWILTLSGTRCASGNFQLFLSPPCYFYFCFFYSISSILKCYSVLQRWASCWLRALGICYIFARKYRGEKSSTIQLFLSVSFSLSVRF